MCIQKYIHLIKVDCKVKEGNAFVYMKWQSKFFVLRNNQALKTLAMYMSRELFFEWLP